MRGVGITCRTAHIGAMAVLVGGHHFAVDGGSLRLWQILTAVTGAALLATEVSHSRHWVYQGRGLITLAHVAVLALFALPDAGRPVLAAALVIGSVGSHLPRSVRKWSFRHGRIME